MTQPTKAPSETATPRTSCILCGATGYGLTRGVCPYCDPDKYLGNFKAVTKERDALRVTFAEASHNDCQAGPEIHDLKKQLSEALEKLRGLSEDYETRLTELQDSEQKNSALARENEKLGAELKGAIAQHQMAEMEARDLVELNQNHRNHIEALKQELASRNQPVAAWQPIETAPKDGTAILAKLPDSDCPTVVAYSDFLKWHVKWDQAQLTKFDMPTHWMPISLPDQGEKGQVEFKTVDLAGADIVGKPASDFLKHDPPPVNAGQAMEEKDFARDVAMHLVACLSEECSEVSKECGKALRFGLDDKLTKDPYGPRGTEGPTNAQKIASELCDLFAVAEMLTDDGLLPQKWFNSEAVSAKKAKVLSYMDYARRIGALVPTPPKEESTVYLSDEANEASIRAGVAIGALTKEEAENLLSTPVPQPDKQEAGAWRPRFKVGDRVKRHYPWAFTGKVIAVRDGTQAYEVDNGTIAVRLDEDQLELVAAPPDGMPQPQKEELVPWFPSKDDWYQAKSKDGEWDKPRTGMSTELAKQQNLYYGTEYRSVPAPELVPLGPEDVPPGSVFRQIGHAPAWCHPTEVNVHGLTFVPYETEDDVYSKAVFHSWSKAAQRLEILRPGSTEWQSCSKTKRAE